MELWLWKFWTYSFLGLLLEKAYAAVGPRRGGARRCCLLLPLCPVYGLGVTAVLLLPQQLTQSQKALIAQAITPFLSPEARDYMENVRRNHDQIIDNVNLDTVLFAGFDVQQEANAERAIQTLRDFIAENRDEIIALRILYDQRHKDRPMAISRLKALYEKLKAKGVTVERLWDCYAIQKPGKVKGGTLGQLADLVSIIRFEMGYADHLAPFADR